MNVNIFFVWFCLLDLFCVSFVLFLILLSFVYLTTNIFIYISGKRKYIRNRW